ncbi:MAG TPA: hypothetical protein DIT43_04385, partial [Dehalococcoidia bacterium]|nr:hypothetical protein [Dehalococcoidia bacterium]
MNNSVIKVLCQVYLLLVLLAVATMLLPLYSYLALFLLLAVLLTTFGRLPARFNIAMTTVIIFLLPLVIRLLLDYPLVSEPLLHYLSYTALPPLILLPLASVIAALPTLYLLDYHLRRNAPTTLPAPAAVGRRVTPVFRALLTTALVMLLLSFFIGNGILLFMAAMLALYLIAILIRVLRAIPGQPAAVPTTGRRIIAGSTAAISLDARSRASVGLHCLISPVDPWLKVTPQRFTLTGDGVELNLTVTPPLAGPVRPRLQLSVIDPRGLFQVNQPVEPVALEVIPRAKYAEWLAMKFLEQTGAGGAATAAVLPETVLVHKRGIEYFDSRSYQPGDRLKDIDWKHSLKLNELIIKEYIEAGEQAAIIAANLAVSDAEEADKLAFKLITTALTLAREAIPAALAVYNQEGIVVTTTATDPREILKETLSLVKEITPVEFAHRFLETPNIGKLRRSIARLEPATSGPAQRLLDILSFEHKAIEAAVKSHPATRALSLAAGRLPPPAVIILVSQLNHDT